jgi:hypothetical protein
VIYPDKVIEQIRVDRDRLHALCMNRNPLFLASHRELQAKFDQSTAMGNGVVLQQGRKKLV